MSQADGGLNVGLGTYSLIIVGAISLVVFTIVALLGMAVVGEVVAGMDTEAPPENRTASPNPETGTAVSFDSTASNREVLNVFSVVDSTGFGVGLTGASDSYVQSQEEVELAADDTWTVSTWASVDAASSGDTMAAVSADGRVIIRYDGGDGQWRAFYYDEGSRDSYLANVSAPDQPGNLSLVTATHNGTHLTIYANTTQGEAVDTTGSNVAPATLSATNWHGTLDETRTFDDATNDSEQATMHANPVAPRADRNRTARLMYDEGQGDSTVMYFTSTRADLSNHSWVDGLPGNDLAEGTDYELSQADGTITALAGGLIDGAPVVWLDYRYQPLNRLGRLAELLQAPWSVLSSAPLVIVAVVVIGTVLAAVIGTLRVSPIGNSRGPGEGR